MVKIIRFAFVLFVFVCVLSGCSATTTVEILHFNDFHSNMLPDIKKIKEGDKEVEKDFGRGVARLAKAIKDRQSDKSLVLFAGDAIQGTAFSTVFHGEESFEALNEFVQIGTLGNHEFDYGQDNLKKLLAMAKFEMVCANVYDAEGKLFVEKEYTIREIDGIRIAIFGVVTETTPVTTLPKNVIGLTFASPVETATRMVAELRDKADVIIAMTHIGSDEDAKLVQGVPGIDIIIGGHSHTALTNGIKVGDTLIAQAGSYGQFLGTVTISIDSKTKKVRSASAKLIPITPNLASDAGVEAIVAKYNDQLSGEMNQVIARTDVRLEGEKTRVRNEETNLGNLIADIQREIAKPWGAELSVINGGGIRESIGAGPISIGDVFKVIPFDNVIVVLDVPGSSLAKIFDRVAAKEPQTGNFLQISKGSSYTIKDGKAVNIIIDGKPIDPGRVYKVSTSDFLADGGDGFAEFVGTRSYATGFTLRETLIDAFRALDRPITVATEGRIKKE